MNVATLVINLVANTHRFTSAITSAQNRIKTFVQSAFTPPDPGRGPGPQMPNRWRHPVTGQFVRAGTPGAVPVYQGGVGSPGGPGGGFGLAMGGLGIGVAALGIVASYKMVMGAASLAKSAISSVAEVMYAGAKASAILGAEYQQLAMTFKVLTGSAAGGKALLSQVQALGFSTPYTTRQLTEVGRTLMGMGVTTNAVVPTLARLGDVAMGDTDILRRLALAFGQVVASGRFYGTELRQFTEAGIGVRDFAETAGMSGAQFRDAMRAGDIDANVMIRTFNRLTSAGGRFYGMSAQGAVTVKGQWSSLVERLEFVGQKAGVTFFEKFNVAGTIGSLIEALNRNMPRIIDTAVKVYGEVYKFMVAGWDAFKSTLASLVPSADTFKTAIRGVLDMLFSVAEGIVNFMMDAAVMVIDLAKNMVPRAAYKTNLHALLGVNPITHEQGAKLDEFAKNAKIARDKTAEFFMKTRANMKAFDVMERQGRLPAFMRGQPFAPPGAGGLIPEQASRDPKISAAAEKFAEATVRAMRDGVSPLEEYTNKIKLLAEAAASPGISPATGKLLAPDLTQAQYQFGMFKAWEDLKKGTKLPKDDKSEMQTAKAALQGSLEAAEIVAKAEAAAQGRVEDKQDKTNEILQAAKEEAQKQRDEMNEYLSEIAGRVPQVVGGIN